MDKLMQHIEGVDIYVYIHTYIYTYFDINVFI
jgi:hypothetical protein